MQVLPSRRICHDDLDWILSQSTLLSLATLVLAIFLLNAQQVIP